MILRNWAQGKRIRTALPSQSPSDHTIANGTQQHHDGTQHDRDAEHSTGTFYGIVQSSGPLACR